MWTNSARLERFLPDFIRIGHAYARRDSVVTLTRSEPLASSQSQRNAYVLFPSAARGFHAPSPVRRICPDEATSIRHPMLSAELNREIYAHAYLERKDGVAQIL